MGGGETGGGVVVGMVVVFMVLGEKSSRRGNRRGVWVAAVPGRRLRPGGSVVTGGRGGGLSLRPRLVGRRVCRGLRCGGIG